MLYAGEDCVKCKKPFQDGDDVVVCPICGAPQHRSCYIEHGGCAFCEGQEGKLWKRKPKRVAVKPQAPGVEIPLEGQPDEEEKRVSCPWCGAENAAHNKFCSSCGRSMYDPLHSQEEEQGNAAPDATTLYGFKVEDKIDNVRIADISRFIRNNAVSFVIKFKAMSMYNRIISLNFSAFFFHFLYFFYRKMYKLGALFMAIFLICMVPFCVVAFGSVEAELRGVVFDYNAYSLWFLLADISRFIMLAVSFISMVFANYWYRNYTFKHIKQAREDFSANPAKYNAYMDKKGGVSAVTVAGVVGALAIIYMLLVAIFLVLPLI